MADCLNAWLTEWFELDRTVGKALADLDVWSHGNQYVGGSLDERAIDVRRALAARVAHFEKLPKPPCTCGLCAGVSAVDHVDALGNTMMGLEEIANSDPVLFGEACHDMGEFLCAHTDWHILKDDQLLEEVAREKGFVMAERDDG